MQRYDLCQNAGCRVGGLEGRCKREQGQVRVHALVGGEKGRPSQAAATFLG